MSKCDENFNVVKMPWEDTVQIFYKQTLDGKDETMLLTRWQIIEQQMIPTLDIKDINQLIDLIKSYNVTFTADGRQLECSWKFLALRAVFETMTVSMQTQFFNHTLNYIRSLVLQLRQHLPTLKWLKSGVEYCHKLHQVQVACILANSFFCTFPSRLMRLPTINFNDLYEKYDSQRIEKIKCIIHYFTRIYEQEPYGHVSYHRLVIEEHNYPRWNSTKKLLKKIKADSEAKIEDLAGHLQVDFAHRKIGGGVLGRGCVQEEIRFIICPELIAARLFTEPFKDNEAMVIIGAERFCNYSGYADSFRFTGSYFDQTPLDEQGRKKTQVLAIDAVNFRNPVAQYKEGSILRELKKAYTGFQRRKEEGDQLIPLATGNWGCGVYHGNPQLKSLIQLMACSEAGREMVYCTFGDDQLKDQLIRISIFLSDQGVSVGELYRICCRYLKDQEKNQSVHDFIFKAIETRNSKGKSNQSSWELCSEPKTKYSKNNLTDHLATSDEMQATRSEVDPQKDIDVISSYFSSKLNSSIEKNNPESSCSKENDSHCSSTQLEAAKELVEQSTEKQLQEQEELALSDDEMILGTPPPPPPTEKKFKKLKQTTIDGFLKK